MRDIGLIVPQIATGVLALVVLGADLIYRPRRKESLGGLAVGGLLVILAAIIALRGRSGLLFNGLFIADAFTFAFHLIFLVGALLVVLASIRFAPQATRHAGEYYALLLLSTTGMMFMVASGDLLTLYLSLELSAIPLYALAGFLKRDPHSGEASLKYLLLGAVSTATLLYGISLIYGLAGTTALRPLARLLAGGPFAVEPSLLLALAFIAAGFAFKISSVPFHMWAPDVYQGAPTPVVAFASTASKAAGFGVLLRVFAGSFAEAQAQWLLLMAAMSLLSIVLGNLVAIPQTNIKRMLAYSSIAQAGYILVGVAAVSSLGAGSSIFYLFQYAFTNVGAFVVVLIVAGNVGDDDIASYAGLSRRSPALALAMLLLLLSLGGIPPLAGFWAKLYVFAAGIQAGLWWLVLVGVLASVVSLYYYLMVVKQMYIAPPRDDAPIAVPWPAGLAVLICALAIVALAYPAPILNLCLRAASALF